MSTTTVKTAIESKPASYSRKVATGVLIYAGNKASGSPITASLDLNSNYNARTVGLMPSPETLATIAAGTDSRATFQPYSSGTFKYFDKTKFVLFGYSGTNTLSGVANTKLAFPASDTVRKSIHKRETHRTLHQSTWSWTTGTASTTTTTLDWAGVVTTDSTDHAARPTRTVPGEFTYLQTGKTPTSADYPAKTG